MEFIIKNGALKEEYYLKAVTMDRPRNPDPAIWGTPKGRGRRWKAEEKMRIDEAQRQSGDVTATWTKDETEALYFRSRKAAQETIDKWSRVLRNAVIVEG